MVSRSDILHHIGRCLCATALAAVAVALLWSCLPEPLEVKNLPKLQPEIVVSTQMLSDQTIAVLLTKSFGALDASDDSDAEELLNQIAITDATVRISSADSTYNLLPLGFGVYGGAAVPFEEGKAYTLSVVSDSLGEVTATTTATRRVTFDRCNVALFFNGFDDTLAQVSYRVTDPAEKNYYLINVKHIETDEFVDEVLDPGGYTKLLDDSEFYGGIKEETFRVYPGRYQTGDTVAVYLSNISAEYYNYMKLRADNRFSLAEFLAEPINYPSNVQGGKGFFNLYLPDIRFFVLEFPQ